MTALDNSSEELLLGNEALRLQQMVLAQQLVEKRKFLCALHLFCYYPAFVSPVYQSLHALRDALFGRTAVQRVVDAHPMDGEELLLAQLAVGKHLLALVAHLDVEYALAESLAQRTQHFAEHLAALLNLRGVDTFTQ